MFIYITTQELTHLFILTQEELFSKIREKSEYSTPLYVGVRMAAYMVLFRSMEIQQLRDGQIMERLKGYVAREKGCSGDLAAHRRSNIHRLLQNEQAKTKN